ncbi:MAG: 3-deoxy-7-phosphoheptulonate synthase [Candidatus Zambryskibacteria bacterium RIFCSPLOWO2_01_FULL_42_41]|nr:MAG: 3-deoxy-7-phosphoheptulonate synthase [Candidatus Zambryskibacteria bacterium RIFCSPHIGHO2_01_FULL_43_60]OHB03842.1 MAG: 3-deoxy-7-phosphoheptulonate synthase [Candidatus Zambryskibacteria bacterium RIFCSPLOWO2_01_FULL_42_41]
MNKETKTTPYPLVAHTSMTQATRIKVSGVTIGGDNFTIMAGPCAVESRNQLKSIAEAVHKAGAKILRGGAYKPRTSPYSFQGLEEEGLKYLKEISEELNMPVVSEIMDVRYIPQMLEHVDILQVGARNMQNFTLLKELGLIRKPVLLKRGVGAKIDELLGAAEYILKGGNKDVILCERGIRTFEDTTRATLDISAVPILKKLTHLPVIVDPSHAAGQSDIVPALALAACAVGADGIIVEVHDNPAQALCDGSQALSPEDLEILIVKLKGIAEVIGKKFN